MLWRLAVAGVSLVGFLGGATLISTQLERDVATGFGDPDFSNFGSLDARPPDGVKPFRFDGITLPKNLPFEIPPGSIVNPDGSITLPDGTKLPLDGASLAGLDINLPTDGMLDLPDDAFLDGSSLTCPSGCDLEIPGMGEFKIPPGASMELPEGLAASLAAGGFSGSNLPESLRIPAGESLTIPQMTIPEGDLTTEGGTRLIPPAGTSFGLPTGMVGSGQQITLPGGTQVDQTTALALMAGVGYVAATQAGYTPGGDLPPPLPPAPSNTTASHATETFVQAEGQVQKGTPFYASGYVRGLDGPRAATGLPGVTVFIFVNESQFQPGTQIGSAVTGADGTFRVSLTIPSSLPAGQYILMANSQATRLDAALYAGAWG